MQRSIAERGALVPPRESLSTFEKVKINLNRHCAAQTGMDSSILPSFA